MEIGTRIFSLSVWQVNTSLARYHAVTYCYQAMSSWVSIHRTGLVVTDVCLTFNDISRSAEKKVNTICILLITIHWLLDIRRYHTDICTYHLCIYRYLLQFNFILGSIFIFFCFIFIIIYLHKKEQRKIKIEPRIKLNYNIFSIYFLRY